MTNTPPKVSTQSYITSDVARMQEPCADNFALENLFSDVTSRDVGILLGCRTTANNMRMPGTLTYLYLLHKQEL